MWYQIHMKQIDHVAKGPSINDIASKSACRIRTPVTAIHYEFSDFFMWSGTESPDQRNNYLTVPNFNSDNSSLTLFFLFPNSQYIFVW